MTRINARRLRLGTAAAFGFLVLAAAPAMAVECGEIVTGAARLDRDLICTTDPALTVDGGLLDLGGFTVVCDHEPAIPSVASCSKAAARACAAARSPDACWRSTSPAKADISCGA